MANIDRVRIPAPILTIAREDTGEEWVVREDAYFDELLAVSLYEMEKNLKARKQAGETDEAQTVFRETYTSRVTAQMDAERGLHAEARKRATRRDFVLLRPTYGIFLAAKGKASIQDLDTGDVRFNNDLFTREILFGSVEGYENDGLMDDPLVSPQVAGELARRMMRSITQEDRRLPFISSPSKTP